MCEVLSSAIKLYFILKPRQSSQISHLAHKFRSLLRRVESLKFNYLTEIVLFNVHVIRTVAKIPELRTFVSNRHPKKVQIACIAMLLKFARQGIENFAVVST